MRCGCHDAAEPRRSVGLPQVHASPRVCPGARIAAFPGGMRANLRTRSLVCAPPRAAEASATEGVRDSVGRQSNSTPLQRARVAWKPYREAMLAHRKLALWSAGILVVTAATLSLAAIVTTTPPPPPTTTPPTT